MHEQYRWKYWVWALLSVPAVYALLRYGTDTISYGQALHETGDWSVGLLCLALAVTPLRRIAPASRWPRRLMYHRRAIGVASFAYAAIHTLLYLQRKWGFGLIQKEALEIGIATGWFALLIMLLLAATSNDYSVRSLRRNWQRLHRAVYFAAAATLAHWVLTALDPTTAYIACGALVLVQALRFIRRRV